MTSFSLPRRATRGGPQKTTGIDAFIAFCLVVIAEEVVVIHLYRSPPLFSKIIAGVSLVIILGNTVSFLRRRLWVGRHQ